MSVTLNPTLAELEADEDGSMEADLVIDEEVEAGEYSLVVTGEESDRSGSAEIEVLPAEGDEDEIAAAAPGDQKSGAPLAQTGASTAMLVGGIALALILTGGVLIALRRRQS
ncbi:LPXTG cell wall anchor domain-containing protein [Nesterenkonia sp. MY13]|uniref:LPXTG cell wall anchor domain-containing protein n=1 Tax=Nesterenkonia sedimenti TaxID=1463632 RepID=A0A7X8YEC0_9MICC|nr:LPXTG cell wall anchor domain-containing protein [Nesterenkonia sedimenti]NLS10330.1 LPXTG cell wall anchor domain-containing protein [Nesterenkonia sedimenti]